MKLTIVYDNETARAGLEADWGFSCLLESNDWRLLFDTGANGSLLLRNLEKLNLDPHHIPAVFISHGHWDHVGGLLDILSLNPGGVVYLPSSCYQPHYVGHPVWIRGSCALTEKVFSTGELNGVEQSLVVETADGLLVICGCSHPGVRTILESAACFGRVSALVGGLHGFKEFDLLADLKLICPCHCTQYKSEIFQRYPKTAVRGGVGKVLEI
jgi:7,8-dihydropterin-6-yl-methyl-4-(beta-D-ribofuranosyl)aminobenzene 5'-phosphate synthase|uniref:MBL fold metallo-hydrolase n=1 Tax=Desulfobacca acetoxidans TaxID=60893 RepID=A0A7C3SIW6_9BACT